MKRVILSIPDAEYEDILVYARAKKFIHIHPVESVKSFLLHAAGQHMAKYPLGDAQREEVRKKYESSQEDLSALQQGPLSGK